MAAAALRVPADLLDLAGEAVAAVAIAIAIAIAIAPTVTALLLPDPIETGGDRDETPDQPDPAPPGTRARAAPRRGAGGLPRVLSRVGTAGAPELNSLSDQEVGGRRARTP